MVPTNAIVRAINGTRTKPIGHVTLDIIIAKHVLHVRFYVLPAGTMEENVVLGRTWCYLMNCQIDWHKNQAKMVYKGHATQVLLLQEGTSTQSPTPKSGDSTIKNGKDKKVLTQETSSIQNTLPPNPIPTTSTTRSHIPQPRQRSTPCSHNMTTTSVTRWIPKKLLDAQGYFNGERNVWLPRQPQHRKPALPSQSQPRQFRPKKMQHRKRTHQ